MVGGHQPASSGNFTPDDRTSSRPQASNWSRVTPFNFLYEASAPVGTLSLLRSAYRSGTKKGQQDMS